MLKLRVTRGSHNPNLQVAITHARHVLSQHRQAFHQRMNGLHRTQSQLHFENSHQFPSSLSFYTAGYWSFGTVVYLFKITFPDLPPPPTPFSRSFASGNQYQLHFFPPSSPSATCIRLPVYFLLIDWAKFYPNLSIARQWVAIIAVKMYYDHVRLDLLSLVLITRVLTIYPRNLRKIQRWNKSVLGSTSG